MLAELASLEVLCHIIASNAFTICSRFKNRALEEFNFSVVTE